MSDKQQTELHLYAVTITRRAYVVAARPEMAKQFCDEIDKWEEPQVEALPDRKAPPLEGWDDNAEQVCVFGRGPEDMSLAQARRLYSRPINDNA